MWMKHSPGMLLSIKFIEDQVKSKSVVMGDLKRDCFCNINYCLDTKPLGKQRHVNKCVVLTINKHWLWKNGFCFRCACESVPLNRHSFSLKSFFFLEYFVKVHNGFVIVIQNDWNHFFVQSTFHLPPYSLFYLVVKCNTYNFNTK